MNKNEFININLQLELLAEPYCNRKLNSKFISKYSGNISQFHNIFLIKNHNSPAAY